jgi:leucyl/phenylalanyl-tRNA--protein transferase
MPSFLRLSPGRRFDPPWPRGQDLVALGGDLEARLVLDAYRHGVFPWYEQGQPVLWWCPDPRAVLRLSDLHVARRLERTLRAQTFDLGFDTAFDEVVRACAAERPEGTWIHADMMRCYGELHRLGHAHSVEARREGRLVGGVYGVSVGRIFAAESMFHCVRDASKVALVHLVRSLTAWGYELMDVQFRTEHLARFGVVEISREDYLEAAAQSAGGAERAEASAPSRAWKASGVVGTRASAASRS